jgi:hypothetical protein
MAEKIENVVLSVGLYCSFFRDKPYVVGRGVAIGQATGLSSAGSWVQSLVASCDFVVDEVVLTSSFCSSSWVFSC